MMSKLADLRVKSVLQLLALEPTQLLDRGDRGVHAVRGQVGT